MPKFPPKQKPVKLRTRPRVKGSIVTGYTQAGIFGFPQCRGVGSPHGLFRIETNPIANEVSNSGFRQECVCLTCGIRFVEIDCEFLMIKASREEVEHAMDLVVGARRKMIKAYKAYQKILGEL